MKKKVRVDFSAHCSIVVSVEDSDEMYDDAIKIAEEYITGNPAITPVWEVDDDGTDDADDSEEAVNEV